MARKVSVEVDGVNMAEQVLAPPPFDIDCPLMRPGGRAGLNYWKSHCKWRHEDKNLKTTCYPQCKAYRPENIVKQALTPDEATSTKILYTRLAKENWYDMYYFNRLSTGEIAAEFNVTRNIIRAYLIVERSERVGEPVYKLGRKRDEDVTCKIQKG